jgi:hypothetical protein
LLLGAHRAPHGDLIEGAQTTRASAIRSQYTDFDAGRLRTFHWFGRDRLAA